MKWTNSTKIYNLIKLTQEEIKKINNPVKLLDIVSVVKNLSPKYHQAQIGEFS